MQIAPNPALKHIIKHYLFLETGFVELAKLRLFSDGNTGIVFSKNNALINGFDSNNNARYLPSSFVYGQISTYNDLYSLRNTSLMIAVFQPHGAFACLGVSASELKDSIVKLSDFTGSEGSALEETIAEKESYEDKIKVIESFLLKKILLSNAFSPTSTAVQQMLFHKGNMKIDQIATYVNVSERTLERLFAENIGLSPKQFSIVVQLQHFLKLLKQKKESDTLTQLGYDTGFYDQSHLIKIFKRTTGLTPKEYLFNTNALAINFLGLKG